MNEQDIRAEVYYTAETGVHYVKICILGMYISNITVQKSQKYKGLWVQMPSFQKNGTWKRIVEFAPESPLRTMIERACIEAVEGKLTDGPVNLNTEDDLMSEAEYLERLNALTF